MIGPARSVSAAADFSTTNPPGPVIWPLSVSMPLFFVVAHVAGGRQRDLTGKRVDARRCRRRKSPACVTPSTVPPMPLSVIGLENVVVAEVARSQLAPLATFTAPLPRALPLCRETAPLLTFTVPPKPLSDVLYARARVETVRPLINLHRARAGDRTAAAQITADAVEIQAWRRRRRSPPEVDRIEPVTCSVPPLTVVAPRVGVRAAEQQAAAAALHQVHLARAAPLQAVADHPRQTCNRRRC